jgi:putative holliday junction resolvase
LDCRSSSGQVFKNELKIEILFPEDDITLYQQTAKMRVAALGLDVGSKRIGVAGCDGLGLIATGITTIWRSSFQEDVAQLAKIIEEREVEILVIGLPYTMDGKIGAQAKQVQKFAWRVAAAIALPIEYIKIKRRSIESLRR